MKETASMMLFFLILGLYSGAMSIVATVMFIIIAGFLTYLAWLEDKKEKLRKQKLIIMRNERLVRQGTNKCR